AAHPAKRLAWTLEDCGAQVLLVGRRVEAPPTGCGTCVVRLDDVWAEDSGELINDGLSSVTADSLAYVIYTSGSTGTPKGVCGTTPEDWRVCTALRLVNIGGERALTEHVESWWRLTGGRVRLFNGYGPTETTIVTTMVELRQGDEAVGRVPIGRPIGGTTAY